MATTSSPTCIPSESPRVAAGNPEPSTLMTARSVVGSRPMTRAGFFRSSANTTSMVCAPATTWLFVTMTPSGAMTKPVPAPSPGTGRRKSPRLSVRVRMDVTAGSTLARISWMSPARAIFDVLFENVSVRPSSASLSSSTGHHEQARHQRADDGADSGGQHHRPAGSAADGGARTRRLRPRSAAWACRPARPAAERPGDVDGAQGADRPGSPRRAGSPRPRATPRVVPRLGRRIDRIRRSRGPARRGGGAGAQGDAASGSAGSHGDRGRSAFPAWAPLLPGGSGGAPRKDRRGCACRP